MTASRGKAVRAEPIAALAEQGKIRHAGNFNELEEDLCAFTTAGYLGEQSPNRADAYVWAFSELFPGIVNERKKHEAIKYPSHGDCMKCLLLYSKCDCMHVSRLIKGEEKKYKDSSVFDLPDDLVDRYNKAKLEYIKLFEQIEDLAYDKEDDL